MSKMTFMLLAFMALFAIGYASTGKAVAELEPERCHANVRCQQGAMGA